MKTRLLPAIAILMIAFPAHCAAIYDAKVTRVSDGDTLWVWPEGAVKPVKLRLQGIDAPEICQAGGVQAKQALAAKVLHQRVQVQVLRKDDYGRDLARLWLQGQDVQRYMVEQGLAWSNHWRRGRGAYGDEEIQAQQARRGIHAVAQAQWPGDFRKQHGPCAPVR